MALTIKTHLCSVFVDDQEKAIQFYTQILGFLKGMDFPAGEHRWLTVISENKELLLEPGVGSSAIKHQYRQYQEGIPALHLFTNDLMNEYQRLKSAGVQFTHPPTRKDHGALVAIFDDTCGNLIQLVQE